MRVGLVVSWLAKPHDSKAGQALCGGVTLFYRAGVEKTQVSFLQFLQERYKQLTNWQFYTLPKHFWSKKVAPSLDFYIRYEHMQDDLALVCSRLAVPFDGGKLPAFKSGLRDKKPYQEFYNKASRQLVATMHAQEIEYFSCRFE